MSSGNYYEDDMGTLKAAVKKILNNVYDSQHQVKIDNTNIQKAHKYAIEAAYPALYAMDFK